MLTVTQRYVGMQGRSAESVRRSNEKGNECLGLEITAVTNEVLKVFEQDKLLALSSID